ncbi:MAG: hypothetical protein AAFU70_05625 [Planctomycetota bacterium]
MSNRRPLSSETVRAVSAENAGNPLSAERAAAAAEGMEPILQLLDGLRAMQIKTVEPAMVFRPLRRGDDE